MAKPKAKRKTATRPKATRPKKRAPRARQRERGKAKRATTSPTVGSARVASRDKKAAASARPPAKRRVVPAKPSKKKRLTRKPAIGSAKKPKRSPLKVAPKPSKASPKPRAVKKRATKPTPIGPAQRPKPKARPKSKTPAAIRARKRRADQRAQREQLLAEAQRLAPVQGGDERRLAWGWLEMIRDRIHEDAFSVDLTITELGGGHATLEGEDAKQARATPWMIVGRFDPRTDLDYADLAHGLKIVADDLIIEAAVHPQRLSQIRVEFHDPNDIRREGDTVLSKIGPWGFVLSDLVYELVGASYEDPAEGSLAARYAQTVVPRFYVFFSSQILDHKSVSPWTVPIKTR